MGRLFWWIFGSLLFGVLLTVALVGCAAQTATSPTAAPPMPTPTIAVQATAASAVATVQPTASPMAVGTPRLTVLTPAPSAAPSITNTPAASATPAALTSPTRQSVPSPTSQAIATRAASSLGFLEGRASIGPLTPVERSGTPATPSPQVCTSRGLAIFDQTGANQVTSFSFQPDCTYRVELPAGTYVVRLHPAQRIGGAKNLPATVAIEAGRTQRLDVDIDTGIR